MQAAIKTKNPEEIVVEEVEGPSLHSGEVLIKVEYCGVCGSDLHAFTHSKGYEFVKMPIILGHEFSGIVVQAADENHQHLIGKKIIVESMHYCGKCDNCKSGRYSICYHNQVIGLHYNGGMAQFVKTKAKYVREIPPYLPMNIASLAEPMSIGVHAVNKASEIGKGDVVLVQGPGIIGFFVGLICLQKGAKVIISGLEQDYEKRLSKAQKLGMIPLISNKDQLEEKVDYVFECSGSSKAAEFAFSYLKKGGKAIFVALYEQTTNLFLTDLVRNEWPIITTYGCDPSDYEIAFEILSTYAKELGDIISTYTLLDVERAFKDSLSKNVLKAVLSI